MKNETAEKDMARKYQDIMTVQELVAKAVAARRRLDDATGTIATFVNENINMGECEPYEGMDSLMDGECDVQSLTEEILGYTCMRTDFESKEGKKHVEIYVDYSWLYDEYMKSEYNKGDEAPYDALSLCSASEKMKREQVMYFLALAVKDEKSRLVCSCPVEDVLGKNM